MLSPMPGHGLVVFRQLQHVRPGSGMAKRRWPHTDDIHAGVLHSSSEPEDKEPLSLDMPHCRSDDDRHWLHDTSGRAT